MAERNPLSRCWEDLAFAVVRRAMEDYRACLRKAVRIPPPKRRGLEKQARELEDFFLSPWFAVLSGGDGRQIIEQLRKEVA